MKVVITGGMGFVGQALANRLVAVGHLMGPSHRQEPIDSLVMVDAIAPSGSRWFHPNAEVAVGDVTDPDFARTVIDRDDVSVFHLAAMVSGGCEADFDGALATNLDGCRAVLEACRALGSCPRLVLASSSAVFGGDAVFASVTDTTKFTPETTYGTTKAISELLVNDYTRKGFLDGRSARLPTVVIRPGRPNSAASSWVSGIFREPLNGEECVVPVEPNTPAPLTGHRTVTENLIHLHNIDGALLGADRGLNLPALRVTAAEMVRDLHVAADRPLGSIHFRPDSSITKIYRGWASEISFERATRLGFAADDGIETIVRAYREDYLATRAADQ